MLSNFIKIVVAKIYKIKTAIIFALFLVTTILLLSSVFCHELDGSDESKSNISDELFSPHLARLNSVKKMGDYIDSVYRAKYSGNFDTAKYVSLVSQTTKERFYFGLSNYRIYENWIAFLSGKVMWSHMASIVKPNDILKHSEGLCSQQTIVFMEILKHKGINVRSVGLGLKEGPGHFICEVHYDNSWRLHDVTKEPQWPRISNDHESLNYYLNNRDSLYKVYEYRMSRDEYNKLLKNITYGEPNIFPAKNMMLFHKVSKILTYILPILFLGMFLWNYKKYKNSL